MNLNFRIILTRTGIFDTVIWKLFFLCLNDDSPVVNTKSIDSRCIYFQQIYQQFPFIPKYNKYAKKYTSKTRMNSPILTIQ